MAISQYWVGQIPDRPIAITVYDSQGRETNLSSYETFSVNMLGSDNEVIDLTGSDLSTSGAAQGRFTFRFPTNRSVFNKEGDYLLQLQLNGANSKDFTTTHGIIVRKLGGVR